MGRWLLRIVASFLVFCGILILAFRWIAHERETVPFAAGLPENGQLIETTEGSFFVVEAGDADAPRILFAHGTAAWSAIWREAMNDVSKAGYLTSAFDMPPFGWSEYHVEADYSRSAQAERVIALLETLDDRPIVVAHSVGAGPVSEAILQSPELVSGYVIVAGAIGLGDRDDPKQPPQVLRIPIVREYITAATATNPLLTGKFLKDFMHRQEAATPETVAMLQEPMIRQGYTKAVSGWVPELLTTPTTAISLDPANWSALNLPVALIWGAEDDVTPVSQGQELAALVPNSTLTVLEDVGHIPHLEAPSEFAAALVTSLHAMTRPHTQERETK